MYPKSVELRDITPGPGGVRVTWATPPDLSAVVVYRSRRAVAPEESEAFYAGAFGRDVEVTQLPPDTRELRDRDANATMWYLVQGLDGSGNLREVPFALEPLGEPGSADPLPPTRPRAANHNPYEQFPELVFREDDPKSRTAIGAVAGSLSKRFGDDQLD